MRAGDHVVAQRALYGGTYEFFLHWFPRLGLQVTFVESGEIQEFASALRPNTKLIYLESPSNPLLQLVPLETVAALARKERLLSFIDNTFASPINQRPHALGIDVVLHSATKFLSGHSDLISGAVTGRRQLLQEIRTARRVWGGVMDPHAAWLLLRGLRTLSVRVERQNRNALRVAQFLDHHPRVSRVHYPFLETHPAYALARKQMAGGGGVLSFEIAGTAKDARRFVEALTLFALSGSLGGIESLVTMPALTTHAMLPREEQLRLGISDQLVRLSLGLEAAEDLLADLDQGLGQLGR